MGFSLAKGNGVVRVTVHAADKSRILHVDLTPKDAESLGLSLTVAAFAAQLDAAPAGPEVEHGG